MTTPKLLCFAALLVLVGDASAGAQSRDVYQERRETMVADYIEREGIENERVLTAMRTVPRHEFVPSHLRRHAYHDGALAIGHRQTISPPFIVAYMTETLDPQPDDKVLEIGTGSGYQAAVLSGLVKEVYTIEIVEPLGRSAAERLERLGYDNVRVKVGDGYQGWPEHAPFDKIIVTCSPEDVPQPLVEQLMEGGRMIIPLGERYQQVFHLFEKRDGKLVRTKLIPTLFVPMTGISEQNREIKPDPRNPRLVNGGFEEDANDDGRPDAWHYQRQTELRTDEAREGQRCLRFSNEHSGRPSQILQGMALDGRAIERLEVDLLVRCAGIRPGEQPHEQSALIVHFYDESRRSIGQGFVGPWSGTADWRRDAAVIDVPARTREAIIRIGLNGATGTLDVDDVRLEARER